MRTFAILVLLLSMCCLVPAADVQGKVLMMAYAARKGDAKSIDRMAFGLGDMDAVVRAAAVNGLAQSWPVGAQHLDQVRQALNDMDEPVKRAALLYASAVNDDTAIPAAVRAMRAHDEQTVEVAHRTLVTLSRTDKGKDADAWEAWSEARNKIVDPLIDRTEAAIAKGDSRAIVDSIHALLFLRDRPATVGRVLLRLVSHPDPAVAAMARSALGHIERPEVVAALARDPDLLTQVASAPFLVMARAPGEAVSQAAASAAAGSSGPSTFLILAVLAILAAVTIYAWPKRKPAPVVEVQAAPAKKSKITFSN